MPAVFQKTVEQDLHKPLKIQYCADTVFTKDNTGNLINVLLYEDGEPYNGGGTVSATAIRADGYTEGWSGVISGNMVSVALIQPALDVPGTLQVFIKVTSGAVETTVFAGVFNVVCTETPNVVVPSATADIAELIASIEAAIASIPADWTSFLGTIAPTFEPDKTGGYAAGAYVWYPGQPDNVGTLYRFTSAHSGTWTGTDVTQVVIGNELNTLSNGLSSLGYQVSVNTTGIDVIQRTIGSGLDPNNTVKSQLDGIKADIGTVPTGETVEGQITDLKSEIDNIHSELMQPSFADITSELTTVGNGYYQSPEYGINQWHADSTVITYSLDVKVGETYKISGYNYYQAYLYFARKATGSRPLTVKVFPNTTQTATFYSDEYTIEYDGTLYICTQVSKLNVFSVKKAIYISNDYALSEEVKSTNAFDPSTAIDSYYMNTNGTPVQSNSNYYAYVPVKAGEYKFFVAKGIFGANASKIPLFDKNKNYLQQATAILAEDGDNYRTLATLTITEQQINMGVFYAGWSGYIAYKNTNMFIYGNSYPNNFIGYYDPYISIENGIKNVQELKTNPLFSKLALFDGDSICNGASAADGSSGWASRIGNANAMGWRNAGIGGATITNGISGVSHYLSTYIDTIKTNYPILDYLILEGGTNDADNILSDESKIGTLDMSDFSGVYDNTTYCGALDTLFYKAINYYPSAKIGFIIAQKMASSDVTPIRDYGENNNRYRFFLLAMQACKKWGIPYLNLWDGCHLNPSINAMYDNTIDAQGNRDAGSMYIDGQHLTAKGYDYISPIIAEWMRTL